MRIIIPTDELIFLWFGVWNIFFPIQLGIVIIPTDEVHHFSEGLKLYHQPDKDWRPSSENAAWVVFWNVYFRRGWLGRRDCGTSSEWIYHRWWSSMTNWLVVSNMVFIYHIWDNPSIDFHIFQDCYYTTNQLIFLRKVETTRPSNPCLCESECSCRVYRWWFP